MGFKCRFWCRWVYEPKCSLERWRNIHIVCNLFTDDQLDKSFRMPADLLLWIQFQ